MRLLLIDVNYRESSTGNLVFELKKEVDKCGGEALVCYGRGKRVKENGIFKFGIDVETYLHALLTRITGYTGVYSFFSTLRLIRKIESYHPDVIHIHELHAYFVNDVQLIRYLKKKGLPLVMTVHCEYIYTGKCGHAYECEKWKKDCGDCPHLHDYISTFFFDHTSQMYRKKKQAFNGFKNLSITVPSEWSRNRIKQSFLREYKTHIIYNGVDTSIFHPRLEIEKKKVREKYLIPVNSKVVLAVAPNIFSEAKGGLVLLDLAEEMQDDVRVVIVGDVDTLEWKWKDNVLILPKLKDKEELAALYSNADLFVLTSKKETFSLTCAEALCCGTRVVGYKCGAPETVFKSLDSIFVEQGDFEALKGAVQSCLDIKWTEEDRLKCAQKAMKTYGNDEMLRGYMRLYEEIINET